MVNSNVMDKLINIKVPDTNEILLKPRNVSRSGCHVSGLTTQCKKKNKVRHKCLYFYVKSKSSHEPFVSFHYCSTKCLLSCLGKVFSSIIFTVKENINSSIRHTHIHTHTHTDNSHRGVLSTPFP